MTTKNILSVLAVLILIALLYVGFRDNKSTDEAVIPAPTTGKMGMVSYESEAYKFSFEYPSGYYIKESAGGEMSPDALMHVTLVDDTQKNRDFLAHKPQTEPQAVPVMISVEVYPNKQDLDARHWIEQTTGFTSDELDELMPQDVVVGGLKGTSFVRYGFFKETRAVVVKNQLAYVFEVQSENSDDQVLKDFDIVLNSSEFTD